MQFLFFFSFFSFTANLLEQNALHVEGRGRSEGRVGWGWAAVHFNDIMRIMFLFQKFFIVFYLHKCKIVVRISLNFFYYIVSWYNCNCFRLEANNNNNNNVFLCLFNGIPILCCSFFFCFLSDSLSLSVCHEVSAVNTVLYTLSWAYCNSLMNCVYVIYIHDLENNVFQLQNYFITFTHFLSI